MKKALSLMLAVLMLLCMALCATGCGEAKPEPTDNGAAAPQTEEKAAAGETYDVGQFTVVVPDGWKAFPASDLFDEYEGDNDPTNVTVSKGAESQIDAMFNPSVAVKYYGAGNDGTDIEFTKSFYEDVVDIDPLTIGGRTFTGFNCKSVDYPYTILWNDDGEVQIQVTIGTMDEISVDDADVQAIIASITGK